MKRSNSLGKKKNKVLPQASSNPCIIWTASNHSSAYYVLLDLQVKYFKASEQKYVFKKQTEEIRRKSACLMMDV